MNNEVLDEYENKIGLPPNILNNHEEYKHYLQMDIRELEKLTPTECAAISYRLNQFAIYIQRNLNKEKAKSRVLNNKLYSIIAPKINQYYGAWDMQKAAAIKDNDAANAINNELIETQQKEDRLEFVATGIKNLADNIKSLQFTKTREER